jgi:hypothetical protein
LGVIYCLSVQGFSLPHKFNMVQFEVTSKARALVLARLLRIEMTQGEDATPTHTNGLENLVFDMARSHAFVLYSFLQIQLTID